MYPFCCLGILFSIIGVSCIQGGSSSSMCKAKEAACILESFGYNPPCVISAIASCETAPLYSSIENILKNLSDTISTISSGNIQRPHRPRHCADLKLMGKPSGVHKVYPNPNSPDYPFEVYCDQTRQGGGWTVIQRRDPYLKTEDFNRDWIDYVLGFGDLEGEFWLGLESMHILTSSTLTEMRVDLEDFDGVKRYAHYSRFFIGDSLTKYQLSIGRYKGDAGDGFSYVNKAAFSTRDMDNDEWNEKNCASSRSSAWWYKYCSNVDLNGLFYEKNPPPYEWLGITYVPFRGTNYSLKAAEMLIRPVYYKNVN